ncbi:MAG TPA: manganese efflux pump [Thermoanaerobaculia bacterium]|nr:manganese efflux pump [Thermoanaerobaculia bacterium]
MAQLLLLGVLAGLDNLQVAAAVSVAPMARARRMLLMASFATCEIASPLLGVAITYVLRTRFDIAIPAIAPFVVIACGFAIIAYALHEREDEERSLLESRWTIVGLPVTLSLDNLLIGVSAATLGHPPLLAALVIGATSASMCVLGVLTGARISRLIPQRAELVSGSALIIIAAAMWIRS